MSQFPLEPVQPTTPETTEDPRTPDVTPEPYQAPQLHQLGNIRQVQGRNAYDAKDKGNDNYFV